ncbi:MAG: rRNA pseudouridine synthase [Synechococcales cyanobacterium T60_A2020_003]|nr:rRNA pseudouridine synthase [Synechococcales cyanobacterium T60_A2020_003]
MEERLQKILSQWGVASRRQAEQLISGGRVRLNGVPAEVGQKADPQRDCIEVDGVRIQAGNRPDAIYLLLNKPIGVVCTCHDPEGRMTILDYVPDSLRYDHGIHPVGRLDTDSTGALLLTNDGALTFALTHPKHSVEKTYLVWLKGAPSAEEIQRWRSGIVLDGRKTMAAKVQCLKQSGHGLDKQTLLEVKLREGRNRQIRRVAEQLGYPVLRLHRVAIGSLALGNLGKGECRSLTPEELQILKHQAQGHRDAHEGDRPHKRRTPDESITQESVSGGSGLGGKKR